MTPAIRRPLRKPGIQVQPKVSTRCLSSATDEDQKQKFREARLARERERLEKQRNCRMQNSSAAASFASASISITSKSSSFVSTRSAVPQVRSKVSTLNSHQMKGSTSTAAVKSQLRRSTVSGRKSILKVKAGRTNKLKSNARNAPKVELKLNKAAQLRLIKADPFFDVSKLLTDKHNRVILLPPERRMQGTATASVDQVDVSSSNNCSGSGLTTHLMTKKTSFVNPLAKASESLSKPQTPSRIPVKKTCFASPMGKMSAATPKPGPLRERLSEWLGKHQQSLENFNHLRCFGILGPAVKRPQTPFRKVLPSTSKLGAIPENPEKTSTREISEESDTEDDQGLNTTFTLEDEDKENILAGTEEQVVSADPEEVSNAEELKQFDQACGVLSELLKLIHMGYPVEQCNLWLRAVRRRFPQCGDEAVYWECLASLEECRGDLESAASYYERAVMQGAEDSVQKTLEELQKTISKLNIEAASPKKFMKNHENTLLDSSNIINSSAIKFEIHEKNNLSSRKNETFDELEESIFTATPVRRSSRLATTPMHDTSGFTCVRSLNLLESKVRKSLKFHGNKALEPKD